MGAPKSVRRQDLEILVLVESGLADAAPLPSPRDLDHGGDQEVAAELDQICRFRVFGDSESLLSEGLEERRSDLQRPCGPAATTNSLPAAAASGRPKTGAAT